MDWAESTSGARIPLDPGALSRDPVPLDVVLHASGRAKVVSALDIRSGDVAKWLGGEGCELRASHWETCPSAATFRDGGVNEHQERMELEMGWIVYAEHSDGSLHAMGTSEHYGEAAVFDVLMRSGRDHRAARRPGGPERYVAYDEADGRELQVQG